jgi:hypothetical protein
MGRANGTNKFLLTQSTNGATSYSNLTDATFGNSTRLEMTLIYEV